MAKKKNMKADKPMFTGRIMFDGNIQVRLLTGELKTLRTDLAGMKLQKADQNKELLVLTKRAFPLEPLAHLAAISSVMLNNFKLTAGLPSLRAILQLVAKSSSNAGWLRSTPFDLAACCLGFAGIYPANYSHIRSRG